MPSIHHIISHYTPGQRPFRHCIHPSSSSTSVNGFKKEENIFQKKRHCLIINMLKSSLLWKVKSLLYFWLRQEAKEVTLCVCVCVIFVNSPLCRSGKYFVLLLFIQLSSFTPWAMMCCCQAARHTPRLIKCRIFCLYPIAESDNQKMYFRSVIHHI